jgi:hypothetical protein
MDGLLKGHVESTVARAREHAVVLSVQDTTFLNYTAHSPEGAGPIGTKKSSSVGLVLHGTVAFSLGGTPLGVLDAQCWARDPEEAGKRIGIVRCLTPSGRHSLYCRATLHVPNPGRDHSADCSFPAGRFTARSSAGICKPPSFRLKARAISRP